VTWDGAADGPTNMGRDAELLEAAERGEGAVRVYTWTGPWLTLGYYQRPPTVLAEMGELPWVMRPTGGKAVRHGDDVTVTVAVPLSFLGLDSRQVKMAYRALAAPLVAALRAAGLPALLAEGTKWSGHGKSTADCFSYSSPNDIVDERTGEKVCGCALRLTERAVLMQASIPGGGVSATKLAGYLHYDYAN
jgi:lipoyl(octanoyl) transferase